MVIDVTKEILRDLLKVLLTKPSQEALTAEFHRVRAELVQQQVWLNQSFDLLNAMAAYYKIR